jgi:cysteine desulfurase
VVFTSGGSESNNHAIKGAFFARREQRKHIITTAVEHPATTNPCRFLERLGAKVTVLPVDRHGRVDPDDVRRAITPETILVTVIHANNEVGTIEPIPEIASIVKKAGIPFHTDAAQTVGKIQRLWKPWGGSAPSPDIRWRPKGVGALYPGDRIEPLVHGAGHEVGAGRGLRTFCWRRWVPPAGGAAHIGMPDIKLLRPVP